MLQHSRHNLEKKKEHGVEKRGNTYVIQHAGFYLPAEMLARSVTFQSDPNKSSANQPGLIRLLWHESCGVTARLVLSAEKEN